MIIGLNKNRSTFRFLFNQHEFPVTRVARGEKTLENVLTVFAKKTELNGWIIAAMDSSGPRLIFPANYVHWTQEYEDFDKSVFFLVQLEPQGEEITVEFKHSGVAKTFYVFLSIHGAGKL